MSADAVHHFHIPVLGLSFSIDTPLKVARLGISSVVSIMDDELLEDLRQYYSQKNLLSFIPISKKNPDYRAERISAYLDMMDMLVEKQIAGLKEQDFTPDSELSQYFELLSPDAPLWKKYSRMMETEDSDLKSKLKNELKDSVKPGSIDVNIMAKVDNDNYDDAGNKLPEVFSDALSALRGFAESKLRSSVVFSAGYNPRLYNYVSQFADFFPDENGALNKKIILKVSDYRSAWIQGKIFAKKGLWVSEFRIESGLNCGGHAFATDGFLLGPVLEEFKQKRKNLQKELFQICSEALAAGNKPAFKTIPVQKISAQGGVGTAEEHRFLLEYFQLDSVGWGSPFLLVPEATSLDEQTLRALSIAKKEDYYLSNSSPLGVPLNNFRYTSSEAQRKNRAEKNRPGSPCYKKYLSSNTEFTDKPICTASRQYQDLKIRQLKEQNLPEEQFKAAKEKIEEKDCLCEGLTAGVRLKNDLYLPHRLSAVAVCPGPNLAYFSGIFSLREMAGHIYGKNSLLNQLYRPNFFVNELELYVNYLQNKIKESFEINPKQRRYFEKFSETLKEGILFYKKIAGFFQKKKEMLDELDSYLKILKDMNGAAAYKQNRDILVPA